MTKLTITIIKFYQHISRSILKNIQLPLLIPSGCKFYPTCSDYAIESISRYGVIKGSGKSAIRILKCNPLSRGGVDNP